MGTNFEQAQEKENIYVNGIKLLYHQVFFPLKLSDLRPVFFTTVSISFLFDKLIGQKFRLLKNPGKGIFAFFLILSSRFSR